jgi:hypothetical protein
MHAFIITDAFTECTQRAQQIQGMRESAANLSDDERRNRASDLALQLMSSLDLGDDSD